MPFGLSFEASLALCDRLRRLAGRNTGVNWGQNGHLQPLETHLAPIQRKEAS
jgi:hypothetical protein